MKIENPFESGHIKNYVLAYVSVLVIMILFFIAATLFRENVRYPKKEFPIRQKAQKAAHKENQAVQLSQKHPADSKMKMIDIKY